MTQPGIELQSPRQLANINHYANGPVIIYIYIYNIELIDHSECDKMMKISGKIDKSNTYKSVVVKPL